MKEPVTSFDFDAAFKALSDIEIPVANKGIASNRVSFKENFQRNISKTDALIEEYYSVGDSAELSAAQEAREAEIAQAKLARIEQIVDLNAETAEELLTSYVGKYIIQCPQCMTMFYKDKEDVSFEETDPNTVNVGEDCQHCGNADGYTIIGKVDALPQEEVEEEPELDLEAADDEETFTDEDEELDLTIEDDEAIDEEDEELDLVIEDDDTTKNESLSEGVFDKFKKKKEVAAGEDKKETEPAEKVGETEDSKPKDDFATYSYDEWIQALEAAHTCFADGPDIGKMTARSKILKVSPSKNLYTDVMAYMDAYMNHKGPSKSLDHKSFAKHLNEGAFSGGYASGGDTLDRHARPGASTQPNKTSYLDRLAKKNPELVDIITVKGKDIKPGMITQAGQVKESTVKKTNSGETKVYIMHTNGYDGYWGVDENMQVMADQNNKSEPFTGTYQDLVKLGLKESRRQRDHAEAAEGVSEGIFDKFKKNKDNTMYDVWCSFKGDIWKALDGVDAKTADKEVKDAYESNDNADGYKAWKEPHTDGFDYKGNAVNEGIFDKKSKANKNNAAADFDAEVEKITQGKILEDIAADMGGLIGDATNLFVTMEKKTNKSSDTSKGSVKKVFEAKREQVVQALSGAIKALKKPTNFYQAYTTISNAANKIAGDYAEGRFKTNVEKYSDMMVALSEIQADPATKKDALKRFYTRLLGELDYDLKDIKKNGIYALRETIVESSNGLFKDVTEAEFEELLDRELSQHKVTVVDVNEMIASETDENNEETNEGLLGAVGGAVRGAISGFKSGLSEEVDDENSEDTNEGLLGAVGGAVRGAISGFKSGLSEEVDDENSVKTALADVEDVHEESLERAITESLTKVYKNVKNFNMTGCALDKNLVVEGVINFKSGAHRNVVYTFNEAVHNGSLLTLNGLCEGLSGKFKLNTCIEDNGCTVVTESLNYSYNIKGKLIEGLAR